VRFRAPLQQIFETNLQDRAFVSEIIPRMGTQGFRAGFGFV
jgi:hypothetical protein